MHPLQYPHHSSHGPRAHELLHSLQASLDPQGQTSTHASGPHEASHRSQLSVLAESDVGKDVGEADGQVPEAQGVDGAGIQTDLVGGEDGACEEGEGFEAILRGTFCAEDALLELGEDVSTGGVCGFLVCFA